MVATRPVDFRRGHDALAATAAGELGLDIWSGVIVIFRSKRGDRLKMLAWDGTGLVLTGSTSSCIGRAMTIPSCRYEGEREGKRA